MGSPRDFEWWWRKHIADELRRAALSDKDLHPADSRLILEFVDKVVLKAKTSRSA